MSFWSDIKWRSSPLSPPIVEPFSPDAIEDANYLLSIGDEIFVSTPDVKSTIQTLTERRPHFAIEPGQFAFLLTAEKVTIPFDAIGFISIRATIKFTGLVNISGFHVDPGYSGKLIFAVFNAGPARIHLKKGQRIFPLWLASLDRPIKRTTLKLGYDRIPPTLINQISGDFTTAYQVKTQLDKIKEDVAKLRAFKYYVATILAALGLILFPIIKDRIGALLSAGPPAITQNSPASNGSTVPPSKSDDKK
jgi:dCTP deaminase